MNEFANAFFDQAHQNAIKNPTERSTGFSIKKQRPAKACRLQTLLTNFNVLRPTVLRRTSQLMRWFKLVRVLQMPQSKAIKTRYGSRCDNVRNNNCCSNKLYSRLSSPVVENSPNSCRCCQNESVEKCIPWFKVHSLLEPICCKLFCILYPCFNAIHILSRLLAARPQNELDATRVWHPVSSPREDLL